VAAHRVSRRKFLVGTAGAGAAAATAGTLDLPTSASAEGIDDARIVGTILAIESPTLLTLKPNRANGQVPFQVQVSNDAFVCRDTHVASLSEFGPNELIVVEGTWRGSTYVATGLAPLYREFEGTVKSRAADLLQTSNGTVGLTPDTTLDEGSHHSTGNARRPPPAKTVAQIGPGDRIWAQVRDDPRFGYPIAMKVALVGGK
jgi:hypothetical protein